MRRAVHLTTWICLLLTVPASGLGQERADGTPPKSLDDRLLDGLGTGRAKERQPAGSATPVQAAGAAHTGPQGGVPDPSAEGSDVEPQNPLQRIGRHMHQVQQRLLERDVSSQTQQAQRQIVTELDELIAALSAQQQAAMQRRRSAAQDGNQRASQTGKQAARDSTAQPGTEQLQADANAAMRQAASEIWGHLPERFRRQLRSAGAVEFLPEYRKLIEDYYKRLAEDRGIQQ